MNTLIDSAELWLRPVALLSWKGTLLTLAAGFSLVLLRRHLSPAWRHGLWLLVLLRFVLPDLGTSSFSMNGSATDPAIVWQAHSAAPETAPLSAVAQEIVPELELSPPSVEMATVQPAPVEAAPPVRALSLPQVLALVWMAGAVTVLCVMSLLHARLLLRIRRDATAPSPGVESVFREACRMAGVARRPRLIITDAVRAPSLFGLLRPAILLPKAVAAQEGTARLRLIFLHELAHLKRWDLASQIIASAAIVLHWFNPAVWWAGRRLRAEAEMAADAQALRRAGVVEAHRMGELLLGFANHAAAVGLVSFLTISQMSISGKGNELRRRIEALMDLARGRHTRWFVGLGIFFLLALAGLTSAPAADDAAKKSTPPAAQPAAGQRAVSGRVVDAKGNPVAQATCMLRVGDEREFEQRKTMSDAEGRFTFEAVPAAGALRVWARHDSYQDMKQPLPELTPQEMADLQLVLQPVTSWLTGTVTAKADGRPIAGATVCFDGQLSYRSGGQPSNVPVVSWLPMATTKTITDESGRYRLPKLREEDTHLSIVVEAPGLMTTVARVAWKEGELTQDMELEKDPGISGKVVTAEGKPVQGATLSITDSYFSASLNSLKPRTKDYHYSPGRGWWLGNPVTGADGTFTGRTYQDPAVGEWRLVAFHEEHGIGVLRWAEWKNGGTLTLEKWRAAHGTLKDSDGKLMQNKEIRLMQMQTSRTPADSRFSISHHVSCVTDDQGRYRLEGLLPRSDTILVTVDGRIMSMPSGGWLPGTTLEHTLYMRPKESADSVKDQRPVKGRIVRPSSPAPLPEHELRVTIGLVGNPGVFPVEDMRDDGSFTSRAFAPGTYELRVWAMPQNRDLAYPSPSGLAQRFVLKAAAAGGAAPLDLGEIPLQAADFAFKPRTSVSTSSSTASRQQKVDAEVADAATFESWTESSGGGTGREQKLTADGKIVASVATNSGRNFLLRATKKGDGSRHFTSMQPGTKDEGATFTSRLTFHPGVDVQGRLRDLPKTYLGGGWVVASVRVSADAATGTVYAGGIPSAIWFAWAPVRRDGSFRFASLPRGSLQLAGFGEGWVTRNPLGYSPETSANLVTSGPALQLDVGTQPTLQGKVRVLLPDGTPAVGAAVSLSSVGAPTLGRVLGRWSFAVETVDTKAYAQHKQTKIPGHNAITDNEGYATLGNLPQDDVTCQVTWVDSNTRKRHVEKVQLRINAPEPQIKLAGTRS